MIGDLIGLPLINGVDCFVAPTEVKRNDSSCSDSDGYRVQDDGVEANKNNQMCDIDDDIGARCDVRRD